MKRDPSYVFDHVSASQIETFLLCPRKWFLLYPCLQKALQPETEAQKVGKKLHKQLEDYYRTGEQPEHLSAYQSIAHLPARRPGLWIERGIEWMGLTLAGVKVVGFIDLAIPPFKPTDTAAIWDHKSTKDGKYAKTKEQLARNPQALLYCLAMLELYPWLESIDVAHNYLRTKGAAKAWPVEVSLPVDTIRAARVDLEAVVARMKVIAALDSLDQIPIPSDTKCCGAFGGCPFLAKHCSISAEDQIMGMFDDGDGITSLSEGVLPPDAPTISKPGSVKIPDATEPADPQVGSLSAQLGATDKPKRGRPAKDKAAPSVPNPAPLAGSDVSSPKERIAEALEGIANVSEGQVPASTTAATREIAKRLAPAPESTKRAALYLYVDCIPTKGPTNFQNLEELIAVKANKIAADKGVPDLRLIPCAEGKALLAAAFKADPPSGVVLARNSELAPVVLEALLPLATTCVLGTR